MLVMMLIYLYTQILSRKRYTLSELNEVSLSKYLKRRKMSRKRPRLTQDPLKEPKKLEKVDASLEVKKERHTEKRKFMIRWNHISNKAVLKAFINRVKSAANDTSDFEHKHIDFIQNVATKLTADADILYDDNQPAVQLLPKLDELDDDNQSAVQGLSKLDASSGKHKTSPSAIMLCSICYASPTDIVFLPCGHICTCTTCASYVITCPICRTLIETQHRVYHAGVLPS